MAQRLITYLEILGCQLYGVSQHAHLLVELQQLEELDGGHEDHGTHDVAVGLIVKCDGLEVDEAICNRPN